MSADCSEVWKLQTEAQWVIIIIIIEKTDAGLNGLRDITLLGNVKRYQYVGL